MHKETFNGNEPLPPAILYKCIAPNYFREVSDDAGTSLDYLKEVCCSQLKGAYTRKQIKNMSDFGIDLWKGLIWVDYQKLMHDFTIVALGEKYRLNEFRTVVEKMAEENKERVKRIIDARSFYAEEEIFRLGKRLGIDMWVHALWQKFEEKKLLRNGEGRDIVFYELQKEEV